MPKIQDNITEIFVMGDKDNYLSTKELVALFKMHLPDVQVCCVPNIVEHLLPKPPLYCWTFGQTCEPLFPVWIQTMEHDGYVFKDSTIVIDLAGRVSGIWSTSPEGKTVVNPTPSPSLGLPINPENLISSCCGQGDTTPTISANPGESESTEVAPKVERNNLSISASVQLTCTNEVGSIFRVTVKGNYQKTLKPIGGVIADAITIDLANDLDLESINKLTAWMNQQTQDLYTFKIEGPAYEVDERLAHHIAIERIVADNLMAAILDRLIDDQKKMRSNIRPPQLPTRI